jgi:zinc carboxypeptidase
MRLLALVAAAAALLIFAAPALATPVATNDGSYTALGRVFPDPLAGCSNSGGTCSPNANGKVPATQFIGVDEFVDAIKYMNSESQWRRYMEIEALDGKLGDGAGNGRNPAVPGNNLSPEFTPKPEFTSAGLPTPTLDRKKSDLMVVRVTDENVPDRGKKRYALSLSIHGIERAGAEGGIRAMEDLVTASSLGTANQKIVKDSVVKGAPTYADVLKKTIIYFTLPNPDGWRRGSVSSGGVFFQRYNGNGVDPNRDWPDIGFAFRGYSAVSEPETKAWISFYGDVRKRGAFSAGDDLHGQPEADALSYTLLPHGRHLYDKNVRIQEAAKAINRSTFERIKWSPIVQSNDQPRGGGPPCVPGQLGDVCSKIYGQTWGSVYDTINYTTTGALGDWFDSAVGLHADGIDNEMSFSHLDKNIVFDPHTEQLHVDGNKALIYAHLAQIVNPVAKGVFDVGGRKGYVPNLRVKRAATQGQPNAPAGSEPQSDEDSGSPQPIPFNFPFMVRRGPQSNGKNIFNGGMRVEVTNANLGGVGTGQVTLKVQCQHCEEHPGVKDDNEWVTVAEDYNQSFLYLQSGVVATVNTPQAFTREGRPVPWRALVEGPGLFGKVIVHFTKDRASEDGNTGGGPPPQQRAYNVANTDFFKQLNPFIPGTAQDLKTINPRRVIAGTQKLSAFDTIALADNPLPGYVGPIGGLAERGGPPSKDFAFESTVSVPGGGNGAPETEEEKEFTIAPQDGNSEAKIKVEWADGNMDFDLSVYAIDSAGKRTRIGRSAGGSPGTSEEVVLPDPNAGKYVIVVENYAAPDPTWKGTVKFSPIPNPPKTTFTQSQKNKWFKALATWVRNGGNLVLTDGALRALPELTAVQATAVSRQTVYAGQSAFSDGSNDTTKDPLARDVVQPGARFNTGQRRQTYEPTPLGFAIQNADGADGSYARQYDVDAATWKKAGGRYVAGSADAGARDAEANYDRVTIGELKLGAGHIRIAGGLLPQPTERYDHQFGLEPYATTYTGYVVAKNLLEALNRSKGSGITIGGRFVISARGVKLKGRRVGVRVSCRTPLTCTGRLRLYLKPGKHRKLLKIAERKFFYRSKQRNRVLQMTISKTGRRIVLRKRRTRVYAVAPVKFRDGLTGVARRSFWLYRPSHLGRRK